MICGAGGFQLMRFLILVVALLVLGAPPSWSQGYVKLYGNDNGVSVPQPASPTNPIPVSINGGTGASVAVTSTVQPTGTALASSTSLTGSVPAVSTTVTLVAPSTNVTIISQPGAANLYVNFNGGAATTANFLISPGAGFNYTGTPAVSSFTIIGAAATGQYSVFAH